MLSFFDLPGAGDPAKARGSRPAAAALQSPIRSSNGAAFEEWLLRACMEADGSHLAQQAATASAGAAAPDPQQAPPAAPGSGPCSEPGPSRQGLPPGPSEEGTPPECSKKPSPLWSAVLSDASTDSRRTLGLDSSSSEEGENSVGRPGMTLSLAERAPRLQLQPEVVSRSPLCPAPRPPTPRAPRAGQQAPPLVVGERLRKEGDPEADAEGNSGVGQLLQALAYPLTAIAAAAGAIMEVVQEVLPLLSDDQWALSSDGSGSSCGGDEVEIEERAHARSIHGWGAQSGCTAGLGAGADAGVPGADTWEEMVRKRRASRALNRYLDQSRAELCANRLFVDRAGAGSNAVPLWQRRQWKQPPSLYMALRNSQAPAMTQKQVMEQLCTPPAPARPAADTPGANPSPLWQRRASRAPTPLGLKFRKPPPSLALPPPSLALGVNAHQGTAAVPAA